MTRPLGQIVFGYPHDQDSDLNGSSCEGLRMPALRLRRGTRVHLPSLTADAWI
jgi:hypothetical protein